MSECSLSGRGQGHVSNFCIVDLENFATASRRYKGDIHNSPVVGLFQAKFHYTFPTGHDRTRADPRTLWETRTDPTEFLGDPGRRKSPCGSSRARVVEFSYYDTSETMQAIRSRHG